MQLFLRDLGGSGPVPLVVVHGLYGSSRNWQRVGRRLAELAPVWALDLRGHGESPSAEPIDWTILAADVLETVAERAPRCVLMGHSLGGKVAMRAACDRPEAVERLLILDIAPKETVVRRGLIEALLAVRFDGVSRRSEVEQQLLETIPDTPTRRFLLTNLERTEEGFRWRIDLEGLARALPAISGNPLQPGDHFDGPVWAVRGGDSSYVEAADEVLLRRYFPRARLDTLEGVGHNVHIDGGDAFLEWVRQALATPSRSV